MFGSFFWERNYVFNYGKVGEFLGVGYNILGESDVGWEFVRVSGSFLFGGVVVEVVVGGDVVIVGDVGVVLGKGFG